MTNQTNLVHYLKTFGFLTNDDVSLIEKHSIIKDFKMGDIFIDTGKVAHQVGFILSGVFRYFFYDKEGNEITALFIAENQFVTNVNSFNEFIPSSGTIIAETDCSVILLSRETWELFTKKIPNWNSILQVITNKELLAKTNFQRQLISQDAKTSYLNFLEKYPTIVQRVPLIHIASFLGITKFSLSRIRKQITQE